MDIIIIGFLALLGLLILGSIGWGVVDSVQEQRKKEKSKLINSIRKSVSKELQQRMGLIYSRQETRLQDYLNNNENVFYWHYDEKTSHIDSGIASEIKSFLYDNLSRKRASESEEELQHYPKLSKKQRKIVALYFFEEVLPQLHQDLKRQQSQIQQWEATQGGFYSLVNHRDLHNKLEAHMQIERTQEEVSAAVYICDRLNTL